ncbi:MAG: 50S ribosomal protein L29 [Candidatus Omnitrophota bacterium]
MKVKELREQGHSELVQRDENLKKEIFTLRQEKSASGKAEKPSRFKMVKKEIARIQTIINERKNQDGKKSK